MADQAHVEKELHLAGGAPPLAPELAALTPPGPALMDRLVSEFTSTIALSTQQVFWFGLAGWMMDRLSGPIMEGTVTADEVGEQTWAIYATNYWAGVELREHWGMPALIALMGDAAPVAPFAELQQGVVVLMRQRMEAIRAGGGACLELLPSILREAANSGPIHGSGYNAGVQVVKTEDPPIGQRRPHRAPRPSVVRINGRDFMRVDYDLATPQYLKVWRSEFERAVTSQPDIYEAIIVGKEQDPDLRELWKNAVALGNRTWGGDSQDGWTDEYWEETIRWASILNFGMEAAGLAAFVALINQDPDVALRAVMCNALYLGGTPGFLVGLLDVDGQLPTVTEA
jgi:hypothetical protein